MLYEDSSTLLQVYNFLDKMSFYTQVYKHKPNDVVSNDDETLWRRQTPKLLYPLGQSLEDRVKYCKDAFLKCLYSAVRLRTDEPVDATGSAGPGDDCR